MGGSKPSILEFKDENFCLSSQLSMYLCILILPFLSFLSTSLLGRFIGIYGSCILSTASIATSFLLSTLAFYEAAICGSPCTISVSSWFKSELFVSS